MIWYVHLLGIIIMALAIDPLCFRMKQAACINYICVYLNLKINYSPVNEKIFLLKVGQKW